MDRSITLSDAFQMVDIGSLAHKTERKKEKDRTGTEDDHYGERGKKLTKRAPVFLWPPQKAKSFCYYLKDCTKCPEEEKKDL